MQVREPCAPHFYAGDCARSTDRFLRGFSAPEQPARVVAAVAPHAGWQYSGAVAAKVFESIRQKTKPVTFVIFGAVHRHAGVNGVYASGAWATPLGNMEIDRALAARILDQAGEWVVEGPQAHQGEHSIEVELPFLKHLFPEAKFVPVAVNPDSRAVPLGAEVGEIIRNWEYPVMAVGSTDLTHYGDAYSFTPAGYGPKAYQWVRENDARILSLAEQMRALEIVDEARHHRNACGAGALAATVAAARALGAKRGYEVEYTTSYDVVPDGEFNMAVGYAGLLF